MRTQPDPAHREMSTQNYPGSQAQAMMGTALVLMSKDSTTGKWRYKPYSLDTQCGERGELMFGKSLTGYLGSIQLT